MWVAIVAIGLTLLTGFVFKRQKNWLMTYAQNFCGALFIVSGAVKAVDPLGTAFKMEQYFAEFESTFEATWFGFLAPMFPFLSEYAIGFSLFMIIFEIALGVMLIIGARPKWTSYAFLALVAFFTVLTGFTFLTGYVPNDANFFQFGKWGAYNADNMKVTDCGCFGDFIKLVPRTSFFKDVFLMIPALYFVFRYRDMHTWFNPTLRSGIIAFVFGFTAVYCLNNYYWDKPKTDFRPFKVNADIRGQKQIEEDAMASVQITDWILKNKKDGSIQEVPHGQYMANFKEYPKSEYEIIDQRKTKPALEPTKISDFEVMDLAGNDVTYEILENPGYHFMVVSYKMKSEANKRMRVVQDTTFRVDTLQVEGLDSFTIVKNVDKIDKREESYYDFEWDKNYLKSFKNVIEPIVKRAKEDGIPIYGVFGGAGEEMLADFRLDSGIDMPYYTADDILIKTIVRSNPGLILWKDGKIVNKWHYKKMPNYDKIKNNDMK